MASGDKNRIIGVALCGFGRAGQIHFHGIRQNHNCKLKYIVDMIEVSSVLDTIQGRLAEYHMTGVRPVSREEFDEVRMGVEMMYVRCSSHVYRNIQ